MLAGARLRIALSRIKLIAVHGPWSRVVGFRHLSLGSPGTGPQPLWGGAAARDGARFTPRGGFDSIYLALDPVTALLEVQSLVLVPNGTVLLRTAPWTLLTVDGIISAVLDLTDPGILKALETTEQEMTGAWYRTKNPPTQHLAETAFRMGTIAGIKYPSARRLGGINLVVFPDRLSPKSSDYLEVYDPHGHLTQRLP